MSETTTTTTSPRLKLRYREEIAPALREEFSFANVVDGSPERNWTSLTASALCVDASVTPHPAVAIGHAALPVGPTGFVATLHWSSVSEESLTTAITSGSCNRNAVEPLVKPSTISVKPQATDDSGEPVLKSSM